jgi:hypothetical protein
MGLSRIQGIVLPIILQSDYLHSKRIMWLEKHYLSQRHTGCKNHGVPHVTSWLLEALGTDPDIEGRGMPDSI